MQSRLCQRTLSACRHATTLACASGCGGCCFHPGCHISRVNTCVPYNPPFDYIQAAQSRAWCDLATPWSSVCTGQALCSCVCFVCLFDRLWRLRSLSTFRLALRLVAVSSCLPGAFAIGNCPCSTSLGAVSSLGAAHSDVAAHLRWCAARVSSSLAAHQVVL
jgi:hypothetical protein